MVRIRMNTMMLAGLALIGAAGTVAPMTNLKPSSPLAAGRGRVVKPSKLPGNPKNALRRHQNR